MMKNKKSSLLFRKGEKVKFVNNNLVQEVEEKREKAEKLLPSIIKTLQNMGVEFNYRIKEEKRIEEKILLWEKKPEMQNKSKLEILDLINDILGITVVVDRLDYIPSMTEKIVNQIKKQMQSVQLINYKDRVQDASLFYKRIHLIFDYKEELPFEIQITDRKNLDKRNKFHSEYEQNKYASVRNV